MIEVHLCLTVVMMFTTVICTNHLIKRLEALETKIITSLHEQREDRPELDLNDRLDALQRMRFSPLRIVKRRGDEL